MAELLIFRPRKTTKPLLTDEELKKMGLSRTIPEPTIWRNVIVPIFSLLFRRPPRVPK